VEKQIYKLLDNMSFLGLAEGERKKFNPDPDILMPLSAEREAGRGPSGKEESWTLAIMCTKVDFGDVIYNPLIRLEIDSQAGTATPVYWRTDIPQTLVQPRSAELSAHVLEWLTNIKDNYSL
jgi:hypothetical protein